MRIHKTMLLPVMAAFVLALAGCGGGGEDTMAPDPMPMPEEECQAAGNLWEDGECKTADDLREEGENAKAAEREATAAAMARQADAEKLHGLLTDADGKMIMADLKAMKPMEQNGDYMPSKNVVAALTKAEMSSDMMGMSEMAKVAYMTTMDGGTRMLRIPDLMDDAHKGPTRSVPQSTLVDNPEHVMGSGFATGANQVLLHNDMQGQGQIVVVGSYMDAMGEFTCIHDDPSMCKSQRTSDGIKLMGTWTFDPSPGEQYLIPDEDYAQYGWWLDEGIDGAAQVGAWYAVQGTDIEAAQVTAASGTATYNGQAVGKAAYYHSLGGDSNIGGAFTADAELMADFDDANGMLSGSITNFDIGGMNPGWSVELMKHVIGDTGIAIDTDTAMTKWTVDGTAGDEAGSWSARFYDIPDDGHQPVGVAGGFTAQYDSDGYMVGAFGAEQ